jgi:hypothetical protein
LALVAQRDHASLRVATREPNVVVNLAVALHSPNAVALADLEGVLEFALQGPAKIDVRFRVLAAGRYYLWLGGNVDRPLRVSVDRRFVAAPTQTSGGDANKYRVGALSVSSGTHTLEILRGGGGLEPGDNSSTVIDGALLQPVSAERDSLTSVAPAAWHSLCGRQLDWIEVV